MLFANSASSRQELSENVACLGRIYSLKNDKRFGNGSNPVQSVPNIKTHALAPVRRSQHDGVAQI